MNIWRVYPYLVVSGNEIKLREESGIVEFVQHIINYQYGKSILDGDWIKSLIICAKPLGSIFISTNYTSEEKG